MNLPRYRLSSLLTPDGQVDFQLPDCQRVLTAAEVESLVFLAEVVDGQLKFWPLLGQRVFWDHGDVLLQKVFFPGGVSGRDGGGFAAGQGHTGAQWGCHQRLPLGKWRPCGIRTNMSCEISNIVFI